MTKYYVDGQGNYVGGFDGAEPPVGAIEVPEPPTDARMVWSGTAWALVLLDAQAAKNSQVDILRDEKKGLSILSEGYQIDTGDLQAGEMAATLFLGRGVSVDIVSITSAAGVASAETQKKHHLVDGQTVLVAGADQAEYNVTAVVSVTGNKTFNYAIAGTPASPATGQASFTVGSFQHIPTTNETGVMIDEITYAQIAADLKGYIDACQIRARDLKNQVLAAPDVAAVDAIDTSTGWPDTE